MSLSLAFDKLLRMLGMRTLNQQFLFSYALMFLLGASTMTLYTLATGHANDRAGKPAGYDADQAPIVSVTKGGQFVIEK